MKDATKQFDLGAILDGLKDFQCDTVDYVFRRLYEDEDAARRFLIADETGLGKTLVARGVIARAIEHLREKVPRIDVLYICSNADIARQNINRLNVTGQRSFALADRITMLPTTIHGLKKNPLNFVSFTPGTSFELGNTMGKQEERALLYHLLQETWELGRRKSPLNVLQGKTGAGNFRNLVSGFKNGRDIDKELAYRFQRDLARRIAHEREEGRPDIRARFEDLCVRFKQSRKIPSGQDKEDRKRAVGELRGLLATACLEALQPDLIILDEFQRFKHLLNGTDRASELAKGLFEYEGARTILLSATPYKMYTLSHESEDDHYADFLGTLEFLEFGDGDAGAPKEILEEYRRALFRIGRDGVGQAQAAKRRLETRLKRVMVRTEKLAASENRGGMLEEVSASAVKLEPMDLEAYLSLRQVSEILGGGDSLEYWKSAPYLLNFMDRYELKKRFVSATEDGNGAELAEVLAASNGLLLPWDRVSRYADVDPANARLRALLADTIGAGAWKLLWIPPSLPYYRPEGAFADPALRRFTKRLVFSSWRVVPKAVAAMVSYEAERNMIRSYKKSTVYSPEAREVSSRLLEFTLSKGRLTGMPVLGMLYPCVSLAKECDPLILAAEGQDVPTAAEAREWAERRIVRMLREIGVEQTTSEASDESWYWAAPILLDLHRDEEATRRWFAQENLAGSWSDGKHGEEDKTRWADHVERARALVRGEIMLGKLPAGLPRVLAAMALAGPGAASLRALRRVVGGDDYRDDLRTAAARVAWHLRSLFNLPESIQLLRGTTDGKPYWEGVLDYSVAGCLQATLDEYAHVLRESQGLLDATRSETALGISRAIGTALSLRASGMAVDDIHSDTGSGTVMLDGSRSMRAHFALRFRDEKTDDGSEKTRANQVREAFNSPFWPFVLATTSAGQEGLDFHTYCHAIVHWNLPSNPVDLEQREGRVHRYKGHAVRKNLAQDYGLSVIEDRKKDPWEQLFGAGKDDRLETDSDLVPFWIYAPEDGARIERHVLALPLSRDSERIDALRRSLAVYRMVFGQARQEDLLAYLLLRLPDSERTTVSEDLRIDLQPPRVGRG